MPRYTPETYFLNPAHEDIARSRYYLKDDAGIPVEKDIFEAFARVNDYIYQNDPEHRDLAQRLCEEKKIMYAGRPLAQAGTGIKNMFNCFVLGIGDSREEISEAQRIHFHIQAHGGGTGINFSKLRPSGSWCKGAAARSSGPEGFITAMGYLSSNIQQGGNRSGANMGILEDSHPGLLRFITRKSQANWENIRKFAIVTDENKFKQWQWANPYPWQTFNVSVGLSDNFMRQVKRKAKKLWKLSWEDTEWALWDYEMTLVDDLPHGDSVSTTIPVTVCAPDETIAWHEALSMVPFRNTNALKLVKGPYHLTAYEWFRIICKNAWEDGCPGIFFIDKARAYHNGEYFNPLDATNPCITSDAWIQTSEGLRQVGDLIGVPFKAVVDGQLYDCKEGFFATGYRSTGLLYTEEGHSLSLTPDHKVLVQGPEGNAWVEARHLGKGDKVVLNNVRSSILTALDEREFSIGWLVGSLLGDGYYNNHDGAMVSFWGTHKEKMLDIALERIRILGGLETYDSRRVGYRIKDRDMVGTSSRRLYDETISRGLDRDKFITPELLKQNKSFIRGFLRGWFDADGSVQGNQQKGISIRLTSVLNRNLQEAQRLLLDLGINSTIYCRRPSRISLLPNGKGGSSHYWCKATYELVISNEDLFLFRDLVGFDEPDKIERLNKCLQDYKRRPNRTKFLATVAGAPEEGFLTRKVFDCKVEKVHRFSANGILVHNCAEQILPPWSVCCLSSIVLPEFVQEDGELDWEGIREAVGVLVRSLSWITLLNETGVEEIDANARRERRIGLGTIGMHELLIRMSLRSDREYIYSQDSGRAMAKKVLKFIKHAAYEASIEMAKEIGPFPEFKYGEFIKSKFMRQLLKERPDLKEQLRLYGIAHVTILTQAPNGTTGTITGYSPGCEPYFAMAYRRNSNVGTILDGCPSFVVWLKEKEINYADYKYSLQELRKHKRVPKCFEEAREISWKDHLAMQAVFAEQVDSSVSKTINLPSEATVEDIMGAYIGAYDANIKSTTIYRDGSKTQILEALKNYAKNNEARPQTIVTMQAPKRPDDMDCNIHAVSVKGDKWKVLVGLLHGKPYEVFCFPEEQIAIPSSKTEGILQKNGHGRYNLIIGEGDDAWMIKNVAQLLLTDEHRMITRLLSTSLRHGAPLSAIVSQLSKCDGDVTTFSKAILRVLKKYISDEEYLEVSRCKACGSKNLGMEEGCLVCRDCGSSACD